MRRGLSRALDPDRLLGKIAGPIRANDNQGTAAIGHQAAIKQPKGL